jgi:mannose-6-phosphate isomerase-like protein (cupin superfamily)
MKRSRHPFATMSLPAEVDILAPDTSEIRTLLATSRASMAHGTLPPGGISLAVCHKSIEEIWYVLGGEAEIWRKQEGQEEVARVRAGMCLTIPNGTSFQFRTIGPEPFRFLMVSMPPWPGEHECYRVDDYWPIG